MGGVDGEGCRTPGAGGLCQERRGLQEARETGEGHRAAGRAGGRAKRALGQRRGWRETKGTPEVKELWGLRYGGSGAEWKESAPSYVPWSID